MGFSRQEYWSGEPSPSPGDLPDPGIKPRSPALQAEALTSEPPGKPLHWHSDIYIWRLLKTQNKGFPGGAEVKVSACNVEDLGSIPGSGRSPGEGNGNPLQYSCLENPMGGGAWWVKTSLGLDQLKCKGGAIARVV